MFGEGSGCGGCGEDTKSRRATERRTGQAAKRFSHPACEARAIHQQPFLRQHHLLFQAELNRRRQEIFGSAAERLRYALRRAVVALKKQLNHQDPLVVFRAARGLLQLAGRFAPPDEPTDPHGIVERHARTKKIEWATLGLNPKTEEIDHDHRARALYDLAWLNEDHSFDPPDSVPPSP